jgi:hypothetical protein
MVDPALIRADPATPWELTPTEIVISPDAADPLLPVDIVTPPEVALDVDPLATRMDEPSATVST